MAMADAEPSDAASQAESAKIREEWRRVEQERLAEEIAEAREDAGTAPQVGRVPRWLMWTVCAVALVAGIVATVVINRAFEGP